MDNAIDGDCRIDSADMEILAIVFLEEQDFVLLAIKELFGKLEQLGVSALLRAGNEPHPHGDNRSGIHEEEAAPDIRPPHIP